MSYDAPSETLTLSDGRRLSFCSFGDPQGRPLVALHGTPGSRLKFASADPIARDLGLRLICPDRWAYGDTEAPKTPTLCAYASDAQELADQLAIDRFAVLGVSGGGPYAVAIAAEASDRVTSLGLFAPVGPIAGSNSHQEPAIPPDAFHRFCFCTLPQWPKVVRTIFGAYRAGLNVAPSLAVSLAALRTPPADRRILSDQQLRANLARAFRVGLADGTQGTAIDMVLFGNKWEIDLDHIKAPARLWLGDADRNIPKTAARTLATQVPNCELVSLTDAGHFWILQNEAEVLAWFRAQM